MSTKQKLYAWLKFIRWSLFTFVIVLPLLYLLHIIIGIPSLIFLRENYNTQDLNDALDNEVATFKIWLAHLKGGK